MSKETEMVKKYYSAEVDREWGRLERDVFHRLEYDTTWRFLRNYLPESGLILDAGGGPGRYTVELARQGYNVVLLDLVAENLKWAKGEIQKAGVQSKVKDTIEGTITDLSQFKTDSFDAMISLGGPLSHVCPESERRKAVSELVRVAKKNAPIFASVMSIYGALLATPSEWPQEVAKKGYFEGIMKTRDDYESNLGYCHFFTSREFEQLFSQEKVEILQKVGLEGLNANRKITNEFASNYPEAWGNWLEIHYQLCTDPFVVDASNHMMIIARKR